MLQKRPSARVIWGNVTIFATCFDAYKPQKYESTAGQKTKENKT